MSTQFFARQNSLRTLPLWLRLGLAPALVCAWSLLRIAILGQHPGWPYEMFVPIVVVSSLCFGPGSGYIAAVLSSIIAAWAFVPPVFSFVTLDDPVELVGFCMSLAINVSMVWMIENLRLLTAKHEAISAQLTDTIQHLHQTNSQNLIMSGEF